MKKLKNLLTIILVMCVLGIGTIQAGDDPNTSEKPVDTRCSIKIENNSAEDLINDIWDFLTGDSNSSEDADEKKDEKEEDEGDPNCGGHTTNNHA